jgi:nicotinamidase-related amidase
MRPSNQSALLIIDVMNHFEFEGGQALARAALPASRAIARLRDSYDAANRPVIYANDN